MSGWQILGWTEVASGALVVLMGTLSGIWIAQGVGALAIVIGLGNVWIGRKPR